MTLLSYYRGLLALATYALFVSDVFRSGFGIEFTHRAMIEPHIFSDKGPFNYVVASLSTDSSSDIVPADVSHYTSKPSSLGLQAVAGLLSSPPPPPTSVSDVFNYLEVLMTALGTFGASPWSQRTHVQVAARANANAYFEGNGLLGSMTDSNVSRTTWVAAFRAPSNVSALDICGDANDRPLFCEKTWAYCAWIQQTPPDDRCDAENLWSAVHANAIALSQPGDLVDVMTIESESDPITYSGSGVLLSRSTYDVVVLTRTRRCDSSGVCRTTRIHDYRYEGEIAVTDVEEWFSTVRLLRVTGQSYNVLRFLCLVLGSVAASRASSRWGRVTDGLSMLSRIPPQVVVYGSWIPLLCYTLALMIDATMFHSITWIDLRNASVSDWAEVAAIHLRNTWLMALLVRIAFFFRIGATWNTPTEWWGIKGHVYGLVSIASFFFIVKDPPPASALVASWPMEPSSAVALIYPNVFTAWNTKMGGLYAEGMAILVVLGLASGGCFFYWLGPRFCDGFRRGPHVSTMPLLYFAKSTAIPATAGVLWDATFLSVSWDTDVLLPTGAFQDTEDRHRLINIVALTDPLNYLWLHFHATRIALNKYRVEATKDVFWHPAPEHKVNADRVDGDKATLIATSLVKRLPWRDWVDCR
ncbi:hypothetical protein SPRG_02591 [Saprolegnia parasitica CBS 223.65]|uniref:Uncharacterized protein n=1 Tax=Saprolegnia parasitica (strain CBS 223.65) TaxID=695850 RepID=A0A067CUG6_SAPPC|nr:hypothetical protein SPRG_02591 [Saprolegnia parasitica CBS 223.65]KDO32900.1 hypothetical protein SPRG_02591 [Saprolegnia parasitica CBS 223.65]|eukprot:XP_012196550.1 hypothetical protein SPRG_02591 [Saprolegnia parasitica CBS 223.65]